MRVSRETEVALRRFEALIRRWSRAINLVSRGDLEQIWVRHILDSLALLESIDGVSHVVDVGSGGGFPAVPLAIVAKARSRSQRFTLVEADQRKAAFLAYAARELALPIDVRATRIEKTEFQQRPDIVTTRAFRSVADTLALFDGSAVADIPIVALKGAGVDEELTAAVRSWHMAYNKKWRPQGNSGHILTIEGSYRRAGS